MFYQNCAEIENSSAAMSSEIAYLPLYTNEDEFFEEKTNSGKCSKITEVLYSENHNICFEVNDSCEFAQLIEKGFKVVNSKLDSKDDSGEISEEYIELDLMGRIKNCQLSVDIRDLKTDDFVLIDPADFRYLEPEDTMCAMKFDVMVNFKHRTCVRSPNSCFSSYLEKKGYIRDYYSICPR